MTMTDPDETAAVSVAVDELRAAFADCEISVHDVYDDDGHGRVGVWVVAGVGRLALGVYRLNLEATVWPWRPGVVEVAGVVPAAGRWTVDVLCSARLVELT